MIDVETGRRIPDVPAPGLGRGGRGPWESRTHLILAGRHPNPAAVGLWLNATYAVQLFRHPGHDGVDHLCVSRHDEGTDFPWRDLQAIKDTLLANGQSRWAVETFPPKLAIVDNENLRHLWVLAAGDRAPVDLREVRV